MANPSAPRESDDLTGAKLGYYVHDNAGTEEAALARVVDAALVSTETTKSGSVASALQPVTSGGLSMHKHIATGTSADSTNVKATPGQVYNIVVDNQNAAVRYLKLYDNASAPTVGTDTPVQTYAIPPAATLVLDFPQGLAFANGIGFGITTGVADSDSTAATANEHVVNVGYK